METSRDARAPLGELFELSPDAILLFKDGIIVQANPAAATLLRAKSPAEIVGRRSPELLHPDSIPIVEGRQVFRLATQAMPAAVSWARADRAGRRIAINGGPNCRLRFRSR